MENTILPFVTEFFNKLGIVTTNIDVVILGDDINIRVETPDSALLIGMHGKNIEIFQHLLCRMLERKTEKFIHVHLEVNDYIKLKEEKLYRFLDSKIGFVMSTGQSARMPTLTSYERKKAHGYIADKKIDGLKTQSEGEGMERALVLSYTGELTQKAPAPRESTHTIRQSTRTENLLSDEGVGI